MKQYRHGRSIAVFTLFLACWASAFGNTRAYIPLTLPKVEEVVAFSNGPNIEVQRVLVPRNFIMQFLKEGRQNLDARTWYPIEHSDPDFKDLSDGIFTDKAGKVYFWALRSKKVLTVVTEAGETALIEMK